MASSLDINRVSFLVLREMRRPIMTLILVYAFSVLCMTLVPGNEVNGKAQHLSFFHAFYFVTYTVTTTGFGELPIAFSNAQRICAMLVLYVGVIAWFYSISAIIRLVQNEHFLQALAEQRFTKAVKRLPGDFIIICGFGDTGSILARGLSDNHYPAVIVEMDPDRIKALALRDYRVEMPGLIGDASVPKHLLEAGIQRPECKALVTVTNDEEVNLRIAVLARLLNPEVKIVARSKAEIYEEMLESLTGKLSVIDPFKIFAQGLMMAITNPNLYALDQWLVGAKGSSLDGTVCPPRGMWVICGYGRMGHEINRVLSKHNIPTVVIDPNTDEVESILNLVHARTTSRSLRRAGIDKAVGMLAATDDDGHNLAILVNARGINANLFTVVRQNRHVNEVAFSAVDADIIMQPSLVTARRILFKLVAPLLKELFVHLRTRSEQDPVYINDVILRLRNVVGDKPPQLRTVYIDANTAPAVVDYFQESEQPLSIGDLLRDPRARDYGLQTVVLVVANAAGAHVLPDDEFTISEGDEILLCGRTSSHRLLDASLHNPYLLKYLISGKEQPRGLIARLLTGMMERRADRSATAES